MADASGNKSIIVLGMHRSRTSLVSRILMELGVFMGNAFRKPDKANPYGYWEDLAWRNINKTLLNASGHTWWNPPTIADRKELAVPAGLYRDACSMVEGLVHMRKGYDIWGFKDPRTVLNTHWLHGMLPDPHYVVVRRGKYAVAESLEERAQKRGYYKTSLDWMGLINTYNDHLEEFLSSGNKLKVHTIDSDDLMMADNPGGTYVLDTVSSLADFIGVEPPNDIQAFMQKVSGNKLI